MNEPKVIQIVVSEITGTLLALRDDGTLWEGSKKALHEPLKWKQLETPK